MARYNKNVLRQQREKYNSAIASIDVAIKKLEGIEEEIRDKNKYGGLSGIEIVKSKIMMSIADLKSSKTKIASTIINLTTEINRPDEELEGK